MELNEDFKSANQEVTRDGGNKKMVPKKGEAK